MREGLPEVLPDDPLPLMKTWLDEAGREIRNAGANTIDGHGPSSPMTIATVDPGGRPSARMVICRGFDPVAGWLVFYTDRESEKGKDLAAHPRASCVFHWGALERQIRVDGPVTWASDADSDAYWNTRPADARIAAVASEQSRPLRTRSSFLARIAAITKTSGEHIPRPPRWGGYRIWVERVELWAGQPARAHDRARWTRALTAVENGFKGGAWSSTRLQP
jgi:pyridoxamine 5'-phosphate oxidase